MINVDIYKNFNRSHNLSCKGSKENNRISFKAKSIQFDNYIPTGVFDKNTNENVLGIRDAYDVIKGILNKKTPNGVKSLVAEYKRFNTNNGITLKDVLGDGFNYSIEECNLKNNPKCLRITKRDDSGEILDGWLISNSKLVKGYNPKNVNALPTRFSYYTGGELYKIVNEDGLGQLLNALDEEMLKLRIFVVKQKDTNLLAEDGVLPDKTRKLVFDIEKDLNFLNEVLDKIPQTTQTKLKNKYTNYDVVKGQSSYTFKNLGDELLKINFSKFDSSAHGSLVKILVTNNASKLKDGEVKEGFLLKDGKLVANYNAKTPAILPSKLYFVTKDEMKDFSKISDLNNYLALYSSELKNFIKYFTTSPTEGTLSDEQCISLGHIGELSTKIDAMLDSVYFAKATALKKDYGKIAFLKNLKGLVFEINDKDGHKINYQNVSSKNQKNIEKINILNRDNSIVSTFIVKDKNKVVKNYNPAYPSIIPTALRFYNDDELENLKGLAYIPALENCMQEFYNYLENRFAVEKDEKLQKENIKNEKLLKKQEKIAQKAEKASRKNELEENQEFKKLVSTSQKDLKKTLKIAFDDPNMFLSKLDEIKKNFENFFANMSEKNS